MESLMEEQTLGPCRAVEGVKNITVKEPEPLSYWIKTQMLSKSGASNHPLPQT